MSARPDDIPPVEIETGPGPDASVIWLHGLGADGHDFEPIIPELDLPGGLAVRFVFPHAPFRPVTLNGGYVMRAWYDIDFTPHGVWQDPAHIAESEQTVAQLIHREIDRGAMARRVVLAGFSQGGAIAARAGLHFPKTLAGLLILSAPIPDCAGLMTEVQDANLHTPVFLAHGDADPVVPVALGRRAQQLMCDRGLNVSWHEYPMPHSICVEEIRDIRDWLTRVFA